MNLSESLKYSPLTAMGLLYLLDLSGLKGLEESNWQLLVLVVIAS
jgi:hypothetical protein